MNICKKCKKEVDDSLFSKGILGLCKKCASNYSKKRFKRNRIKAIVFLGGKCNRCNYKENYSALDFHHLDPNQKDIKWVYFKSRSWEKIVEEISKCVLLCSRCHREVHNDNDSQPSIVYDIDKSYEIKIKFLQERFKHDFKFLPQSQYPTKPNSENNFCDCGAEICKTSQFCINCRGLNNRKVKRPSKEELEKLIWEKPIIHLAKDYDVSDNAIRKWCKKYGIDFPSNGYWLKKENRMIWASSSVV